MATTLVVDGANVVGSVPDQWWRDRAGAARRLRDALAPIAAAGLPQAGIAGPCRVVLVVEGAARGLSDTDSVRVVSAPGSGDDTIVDLVREHPEDCVVVTADRDLRERTTALGARVIGPRALPQRR